MALKANVIDLGDLQDTFESAEVKLKRAATAKTNAYNAYLRAVAAYGRAYAAQRDASDNLRHAVDSMTV